MDRARLKGSGKDQRKWAGQCEARRGERASEQAAGEKGGRGGTPLIHLLLVVMIATPLSSPAIMAAVMLCQSAQKGQHKEGSAPCPVCIIIDSPDMEVTNRRSRAERGHMVEREREETLPTGTASPPCPIRHLP